MSTVKIKLNGKELEVPAGSNLLKVCLDQGDYIPHFCYHPGLQPEGNCRMCLVKHNKSRKLEVSCMTNCFDGLEVETQDPSVIDARHDVLEFMLANHPLDCPICDKSGECDLQDFTFDHRGGLSRQTTPRVKKHTKDVGPNIKIWGERCVVCTRCVRFLNDEVGTGELSIVNRGDRSVIDVFPGLPVDNPMLLNVVDVCPVGCLIDKNFMYQARVWYAKEEDSICTSCSRGCNVKVTAMNNQVQRQSPRLNEDVNGYWMCDAGRLNINYVSSERRLIERRGTPDEVVAAIRDVGAKNVAVLFSTWQTAEELFLFKALVDTLGIERVGVLTRTEGERWESKGGFAIEADKTPNRRLAEAMFGPELILKGPNKVIADLHNGDVQGLFVVNGLPDLVYPQDLVDGLPRLDWLGVMDILESPLSKKAHVVLPGATVFEKHGVFVNVDGRAQLARPVLERTGAVRTESEMLQQALVAAGARSKVVSSERVFLEAAKEIPMLRGLDYGKLTKAGVMTNGVAP